MDRLAERFSQHPQVEVGGRPSSSATTTSTTTTTGDQDVDPNIEDEQINDEENEGKSLRDKELLPHCFKYGSFITQINNCSIWLWI